jgi:carbon storage regulator CsrA
MLVLTRKLDETIRIGEGIRITVLRVKGNTVRIGIEAPKQIRVVREELQPLAEVPGPIAGHDRVAEQSWGTGSVVATVVDSPEPTGNRVFVGKLAADGDLQSLREESDLDARPRREDQSAPLRAFLRPGSSLQAAG